MQTVFDIHRVWGYVCIGLNAVAGLYALAAFKVPEYVEFRDEPLPRNPAGKILKQLLRGDASASAFASDAADDAVL